MTGEVRVLAVAAVAVFALVPAARAGAVTAGRGLAERLDASHRTSATHPAAAGAVANPVPGSCVSSGYGKRWGSWHYGLDLAAPLGTPIRAVAAGVVTFSATADPGGYGQYMRVKHASGAVTEYGHMRARLKHTGDRVAAGEAIALVGQEGSSTGPHLHLRVYPAGVLDGKGVDPRPWLAARGVTVRTC